MKRRYILSALPGMLLSATVAQASVESDMKKFFNDMTYSSNATSAKSWQGQAARYMTGGSFYSRTGVKNIQMMSISLPSISSGCGGIDVYLGALSFINADQFIAFMKQIMANSPGYMFEIALKTTVPELAAAKDYVQKLASDMNQFNMSSCQAAQGIVGGMAAMWSESQQAVCQSVAGQNNIFSDWAASRQGCTTGGGYDKVTEKAKGSDADHVLKNINLMWTAMENSALSNSQELRQFAMSVSGTVTFDNNGTMRVLPSLISNDKAVLNAMMNGGTASVYVCDNANKCLAPSINKLTIGESSSLISMTRKTLEDIQDKAITDTALTDAERKFINSTSIPILTWIIDQSSLSVTRSLFDQLADYIACDIYLQYMDGILKQVNAQLAGKDYPGESMKLLRNSLHEANNALNTLRMDVQVKESALISAQNQIQFLRQQVSSQMTDRYMGNYQFGRVN
ncbi:F-type conjugal transfer protein TraH [Enterobacter asburiae]|uniref:conjugal transfer pilus assembly protein TraH n=1 Tax=Enterobacter asburiae TaxID=61645 RepID=UPI0018C28696|nr:conjugal transfer pilus assembly protein TraH [Enterobacter asburiae]MBG0640585.1 F-type conjugal transfer protein TraH [Enterobacter asburiae]